MTYAQTKIVLDTLTDYPVISNYIKTFENKNGFIFTVETDPERKEWQRQMNVLLDDGTHSGATWSCMMRTVKAVLNGKMSYAEATNS